jgi:hypothetical protein
MRFASGVAPGGVVRHLDGLFAGCGEGSRAVPVAPPARRHAAKTVPLFGDGNPVDHRGAIIRHQQ